MRAVETTAPFGRVERLGQASFTPQMEESQNAARESPPACLGFGYLANSLVQLLETARRELERDPEVAKASLVTASNLLQAEAERYSSAGGTAREGLAPWQMLRPLLRTCGSGGARAGPAGLVAWVAQTAAAAAQHC